MLEPRWLNGKQGLSVADPMMMLAKEMIAGGEIGEVRKVDSWYNQGWLATALEKSGQQQASWRTDPKRTGISNCGGDIGTHAFVAATWVTGLAVKRSRPASTPLSKAVCSMMTSIPSASWRMAAPH